MGLENLKINVGMLSNEILAGYLNKKGDMWRQKTCITEQIKNVLPIWVKEKYSELTGKDPYDKEEVKIWYEVDILNTQTKEVKYTELITITVKRLQKDENRDRKGVDGE